MDMYNEISLVLELCKYETDNKAVVKSFFENSELDLAYVLGQLQFNRVGGVAYYVLKKHELLKCLNREFRNTLKTTYNHNLIKTHSFLKTEEYLCEILENVDIRYALLKGAYLVQLYPMGLRTSNDIDMLINEKDLSKIENILKEEGFEQGNVRNDEFEKSSRAEIVSSRMNRGETVPWIKQVNWQGQKFIEIDLNFSLDYKASGSTGGIDKFLKSSQSNILTAKGELNSLSSEDCFIQLCTHLYKEATTMAWVKMKRDLCLYKFVDIYLFVNHFFKKTFVEALANSIIKMNLQKECLYTLIYTKRLFDMENEYLDNLIRKISLDESGFLNQVYDPVNGVTYEFDMEFQEWMFLPNRVSHLKEVKK